MVQIKEEYDPDINYHEVVYRYAEEENQVSYYDHISIRNQVRSIWNEKKDIKPKIEPKVEPLDDDEPNGEITTEKASKRKRYEKPNTMSRKKQRRDGGNLNGASHEGNEFISHGIEIKQEPTIKLEPADSVKLVPVLVWQHAVSGSSGGMKKARIDKETEQEPGEDREKDEAGPSSRNNPRDVNSNQKQLQPKRGPIGRKKVNKSEAAARNKPKAVIRSNNKKPTASKGTDKQHKCSTCDYSTPRKLFLEKHIRTHTGEKPFPCTHCAKRFTQKIHLQTHMRTHVSEFLFSCSKCLRGFSQNIEKSEHEINCTVRQFECHLCRKCSNLNKSSLKYHMRVYHTGERPFRCDQCSKKFHSSSELKSHKKTHINRRPSKPKCSTCYRNFSQQIEKDEHEAKCNRRGYECYVCKEYTSHLLGHLKRHMRIHSGERPFQCQMCQKSFASKQSLENHQNRIHK